MPVRIYDISKKLGLENKAILAKAKALGIAAAKVPSSSLDKISAEFLEEELFKDHPELAAKFAAPPVVEKPKPAPVEEKIVVITAPPPEPKPEVKAEPRETPPRRPPPWLKRHPRHRLRRPNRPDRNSAKRSGSFNCRNGPRPGESAGSRQTGAVTPGAAQEQPHFTRSGRPGGRTRSAETRPASRPSPPPRRRPNLSRRRPARSLSSSRRLSCANWPCSSSKSRSRSSPI